MSILMNFLTLTIDVCAGGTIIRRPESTVEAFGVLGRVPGGTLGDGDCLIRSVLQSIMHDNLKGVDKSLINDELLTPFIPELRSKVASTLFDHPAFAKVLRIPTAGQSSEWRTSLLSSLNTTATPSPDLSFEASEEDIKANIEPLARNGGAWFNGITCSALAAVMQRNILCVDENSAFFHPAVPGSCASISAYGRKERFTTVGGVQVLMFNSSALTRVPAAVFERETIVVGFRVNHFWYTSPKEGFDSEKLKAAWGYDRLTDLDFSAEVV